MNERTNGSPRRVSLLLLGAWFGLATGFGELALLAIQEFVLDRYLYYISRHTIWMIPAADTVIFAAVGLLLAGVRAIRPTWIGERNAVFVLAFLGFTALAYFVDDKLHDIALLLLAAGAATQATRLWIGHRTGSARLVRWSTPVMLAVIGIGSGVASARAAASERGQLAGLGEAPAEAPNVLLIIWDTVRSQDLSAYGYDRATTPVLARLAEGGVRFENAASTASWTLPSHASMFTGHYPYDLSTSYTQPLDDARPTLAEALRDRGYVTGGFVANFGAAGWESGLARGFTRYEDFPASPGQLFVSARLVRTLLKINAVRALIDYYDILGRKNAPAVTRGFLEWQSRLGDRPFFAFLNYYDAHAPYLPPEPYATEFGPARPRGSDPLLIERMNEPSQWPAAALQAEVDAYDGAIRYLDDELELLLGELERRGIFENTLVILTSDHGEEFGEHDMLGHGDFLWPPLIRVPLVLSLPTSERIPRGRVVVEPVGLRNLPATVLDLIGESGPSGFPGFSLARSWSASDPAADDPAGAQIEPVLSQEEGLVSVLLGRYQYLRSEDGDEMLFDLATDPIGQTDLAEEPGMREVLDRLRPLARVERSGRQDAEPNEP